MPKKNAKNVTPHVFLILIFLVVLASILTFLIPAGQFQRTEDATTGQMLVVADSFHKVENTPVPLWKIPEKLFESLISEKTAALIFFILFIGGSFEIIMQTGSITRFFERLLVHFENKKIWIIPMFVTLFSVLGFTMGLSTASVIFVPIGILAAKMLGFDLLTGTAMVTLGTNAGFAAGIFNPFSVGIAQSIAEVPIFSGAWIRWILLVCLLVTTSVYIMHYAKKYDSSLNAEGVSDNLIMTGDKYGKEKNGNYQLDLGEVKQKGNLSLRHILLLVIFAICFIIITYGISTWKWEIENIGVLIFITGILCGFVYGFSANEICDFFVNGSKKMMKGVFVIGLASTMRLILTEGNVMDTIAYYLTGFAYPFPNWAKLIGMFYGNAVLDLIVTSGSAHAAVAMPIMVPMADYLGLSRQSAVLAFQLGDGLVNLTSPISTTLTGVLAVSGISYGKWLRFFAPLVAVYMVIGTLIILLAGAVGY
ncbi:MAG: AbgT family transporter [Lachnospiraceae bacterium]|nr:AbgT family transporter [Lachnospiraceae bacterium]